MKKIFLIFLGLPVRAKICGVSYGRFGHEKAEIQLRNAESCEFQIHPEGNGKVKFRSVFNLSKVQLTIGWRKPLFDWLRAPSTKHQSENMAK